MLHINTESDLQLTQTPTNPIQNARNLSSPNKIDTEFKEVDRAITIKNKMFRIIENEITINKNK